MGKSKKFFSFMLAMVLLLSMSTNVFAIDRNSADSENDTQVFFSEKDMIILWLTHSDEELKEMGYSDEELKEIRSYDFENMFSERAALPYETLVAFGYTDDQISTLKNYDGQTITAQSPVLAATGDVSITFQKSPQTSSSTGVWVNAYWNWSIVPMVKFTDVFVLTWSGVDSNGYTIALTPTSRNAVIQYYSQVTGYYDHVDTVTASYVSTENKTVVSIPMAKNDNYFYAKAGTLAVKLTPAGTAKINYVNLGAAYGHKTVTPGPISVSVGAGLSISFGPPLLQTKSGGDVSGRVYSGGNVENH